MKFDPNNNVVRLCAEGMDLEGQGKPYEASRLFSQAWDEAHDDFERVTAAHYVARNQANVADKLRWDETALDFALRINSSEMNAALPSLYLNVGKGYEDVGDFDSAKRFYELALTFVGCLQEDGYGNMIRAGIAAGIARVST